ncbi:MAG: HD domain-containing protein [Rhodospirillales bacterium]|nr:HD domain-containing protein [Rhodospirillales bacterium]
MTFKTNNNSSFFITALTAVFSRPPLAALVVGTTIHLFSFLNSSMVGVNYLTELIASFEKQPLYGLGKLIIPFLVPGIVTLIGKMLSGHRQRELMGHFPEMNPDLVLKLDQEGNVEYFNPSVRSQLTRLSLDEDAVQSLLPPNYTTHVESVVCQDKKVQTSFSLEGVDIDYTFRGREGVDSVFVSGHDSTKIHSLQRHLAESQSQINKMTDFLGAAFSDYERGEFDLQDLHKGILRILMTSGKSKTDLFPTHVFLAEFDEGLLKGYIYCETEEGIIREPDEIIIDPRTENYAILQGVNELTWANWEDEGETIECFQERFHPSVRERIGTIERFTTFNSGRIALVAYYKGRKVTKLDANVLKGLAVYASGLHRISHEQTNTEKAFIYTVNSLARASEANDEDTGDHIVRINEYSRAIAEAMGQSGEFIRTIHYSAQMHDVGKIHVNPDILKKPGRLTDDEFTAMKSHPVYGAKILGDSPRMAMAAEIALGHHEKYNGKGYPNGLSGDDIPLSARIVGVVDVYDALRQERVYKPGFSHEKTLKIITEGDGRTDPNEFDPKVLEAFLSIETEMARIFDHYDG